MRFIVFFVQQLLSVRRALYLIIAFCLLASAAQAEDAIRQAVKLRIEKSQGVETDIEIELKKGEESSPIAPQMLDGFEGQVTEVFAPGPQEKKKILVGQKVRRGKAKVFKAKKRTTARRQSARVAKKRRAKKSRKFVRNGKAKRRPASKKKRTQRVRKKLRFTKGK